MAGFADLITTLVGVADKLTESVQVTVTHYAFSDATQDDSGKTVWGSGTPRLAIVEDVNTISRNQKGELIQVSTKVTFLRDLVIDVRDKIVLPNGKTGPIARISGLTKPDSSRPYLIDVYLSSSGGSGW